MAMADDFRSLASLDGMGFHCTISLPEAIAVATIKLPRMLVLWLLPRRRVVIALLVLPVAGVVTSYVHVGTFRT